MTISAMNIVPRVTQLLRLRLFPRQALPMRQPTEQRRPATYADLEAVPPNKVAELIDGTLYVMSRPAPKHANTSSVLGIEIGGPFQRRKSGPGGWWILDEPELHFPNPAAKDGEDILVPDLAGWRRERMPTLPKTAFFALAPDWVCEVLSESTEEHDRENKLPVYAREGVHRKPSATDVMPARCASRYSRVRRAPCERVRQEWQAAAAFDAGRVRRRERRWVSWHAQG